MKLKSILSEINLEKGRWEIIPHEEIDQYEKRIFDLINTAYSEIGGNPNFKTQADVANPKNNYEVLDVNGDQSPGAVNVFKKSVAGNKIVATGHDNSQRAKGMILRHKISLLHKTGYFGEVSGKLKDILVSNGVPVVNDKDVVLKALGNRSIEWHGDGTYTREIEGHKFIKVMVGKPIV